MRQLWLCVAIVIILLNGCGSTSTDTPQSATDQPSVSIVRSPTKTAVVPSPTLQPTTPPTVTVSQEPPTATPSPSLTPSLAANDTEDCLYTSRFVEDITIQDGSVLPTGQQVEKIWRIRNTSSCGWGEGTSIIHINANRFDSPGKVPIPSTPPGEEVEITIRFTTPNSPGTYESYWRLENVKGELFGGVLFLRFKTSTSVKSPVPMVPNTTPEPINTPDAPPTSAATPIATPVSAATQKPTTTPVLNCGDYNPQFMGVLSQASLLGLNVGCALGTISQNTGTVQEFWFNFDSQNAQERLRSLFLKNNGTGPVYVLVGKDSLTYEASVAKYEGTDAIGDEVCGAPTPPDGYFIPQNCFTTLWCEKQYWKTAGWPRLKQANADLVMQKTERGILIRVSALPTTVYYLALDLETNRGTVQMGP